METNTKNTYFEDIVKLYLTDSSSFDAETLYLAAKSYMGARNFNLTDSDVEAIWHAINKPLGVDEASGESIKNCMTVNCSNGIIEASAPPAYAISSYNNCQNRYLASKFVTSYKKPELNIQLHLADISYFWGGDGKNVPSFDCVILESWGTYPFYRSIDGDFKARMLNNKEYYFKRCCDMVAKGGVFVTFLDDSLAESEDSEFFDDIFQLKNIKLAIKYF